MCGIFALLNNESFFSEEFITMNFEKGRTRGPEFSKLENIYNNTTIGFHRLAINGLNSVSNQPIVINDISLICNGEIYNYREMYQMMNITPVTQSDCEVIIHLYIKYGIEQCLQMLDGVFAFILIDNRIKENDLSSSMFIARDPYGVRPLYCLKPLENNNTDALSDTYKKYNYYNEVWSIYGFASELKVLSDFNKINNSIEQFTPGTYSTYFFENPYSK